MYCEENDSAYLTFHPKPIWYRFYTSGAIWKFFNLVIHVIWFVRMRFEFFKNEMALSLYLDVILYCIFLITCYRSIKRIMAQNKRNSFFAILLSITRYRNASSPFFRKGIALTVVLNPTFRWIIMEYRKLKIILIIFSNI